MKKNEITGKETIIEILNQLPEAEAILTAHGLHCVGCSVRSYETLEEGCRSHGFTEPELQNILEDLNLCSEEKKRQKKVPVFLTPKAAQKIKQFQKEQNKIGYGVTVKAKKQNGTWNYSLDFSKTKPKNDQTIESQTINLYLSLSTNDHLQGYKIDYLTLDNNEGFKFEKNL